MTWRRRSRRAREAAAATPTPAPTEAKPDGGRAAKTPAQELGKRGEAAAADHLRALGFSILERNLRTRIAEIDLLVAEGRTLIAVEVKTRSHHEAPEWTVRPSQLAALRRTLLALASSHRPRPNELRVDVVAVRRLDADRMDVRHFPGLPFSPDHGPP